MTLPMRIDGEYIIIEVIEGYEYDCRVLKYGNKTDAPALHTAWGWVSHLQEKNWWSKENEKKFLRLARKMTSDA